MCEFSHVVFPLVRNSPMSLILSIISGGISAFSSYPFWA
jgi:hypothetical protein